MDAQQTATWNAAVKQANGLIDAMEAAYVMVVAVLAALPIPMHLPAVYGDSALSLSRAWEMAAEEPLLPMTIDQVRTMITAWLTAWELIYVLNLKGPAPWRLRAVEDAIARVEDAEKTILRHLACDFRAERLTDEEIAQAARIVGDHIRVKRQRRR